MESNGKNLARNEGKEKGKVKRDERRKRIHIKLSKKRKKEKIT